MPDKVKAIYKKISSDLKVLIALLFILLAVIVFTSFNIYADTVKQINILEYFYKVSGSADYKVELFENSFYEEQFLGPNNIRSLPQKFVKSVIVDFSSLFTSSKIADVKYDYDIRAEIVGTFSGSNFSEVKDKIWNPKYVLRPSQNKSLNGISMDKTTEQITLDYVFYYELYRQFQQDTRLSIDADLVVNFRVRYTIEVDGKPEEVVSDVQLIMPLSKPTFKVDIKTGDGDNVAVYRTENVPFDYNKNISNFLIIIFSLGLAIFTTIKLTKVQHATQYNKNLNKILKDHADLIAESTNVPKFNDDILEIKHFHDLVDIVENTRQPIIYCIIKEDKESWFIVNHDNKSYRYILTDDTEDEDLKEKTKTKKVNKESDPEKE